MSMVASKLLTVDDFDLLPDPPDGSRLELIRGEVVVMPSPQGLHGICCSKIDRLIGNFVDDRKLGWVTSNDTGVLLERDPDTLRGPDVALWSIARQPLAPERYFEIPPDLAVEVLSPSDRRSDVRSKIEQFLFHGVKLVWLIDPSSRTVTVYERESAEVELGEDEKLSGSEVLPGFECNVSRLFP